MNTDLTPAEQAIVGEFTKQLGLALRRIAGVESAATAVNLPQAVPAASANPSSTSTPARRKSTSQKDKQHED